jgi:hypothetical protein
VRFIISDGHQKFVLRRTTGHVLVVFDVPGVLLVENHRAILEIRFEQNLGDCAFDWCCEQ